MSRVIHCEVEDQNGRVFSCINCSLVSCFHQCRVREAENGIVAGDMYE